MTTTYIESVIAKMPGVLARCLMGAFVERPVALWSTILEFVAIVGVATCGLALNYRFLIEMHKTEEVIIRKKDDLLESF